MKRFLIVGSAAIAMLGALIVGTQALAGPILPGVGGIMVMGCDGADGLYGPTSSGLGCEGATPGEQWDYWQPITEAYGDVTLNGQVLTVSGRLCADGTECVGIGDRMVILTHNALSGTAQVIREQKLETIVLDIRSNGMVHIGGAATGYLVHVDGNLVHVDGM